MRQLATGVALLGVLASGCSDGAEPPTTLPSLTASATPSAAAVPRPSGIDAPDAIGASAFARYWFDVLNAGFLQRDTSEIRRLSEADCGTCGNFIASIEELRAKSQRLEGGAYVLSVAEAAPTDGAKIIVDLIWDRQASRLVASDGSLVEAGPASKTVRAQALLVRKGSTWSMSALRLVTL